MNIAVKVSKNFNNALRRKTRQFKTLYINAFRKWLPSLTTNNIITNVINFVVVVNNA